MIEVFDAGLKKLAILQNAYDIKESLPINAIYHLTFSLPYQDPKRKYCQPFNYVRFGKTLYRILPEALDISSVDTITYECEHVIATLIDDIMPGDAVVGNLGVYTEDVINYILNRQETKRWVLGVCEFSRQFEYGWSNESLLSALFSVPNSFVDPYIWEYDTAEFPWVINLRRLDTNQNPQMYIRRDKNLISLKRQSDPTNLCTRLYAYGYGEGINALTFSDINGGKPYIESPQEYKNRYGIKTKLWVDRRYENKDSLLQAARAMLNELQEPGVEYEVEFVQINEQFYNTAQLGKVVEIIAGELRYKTYVTGIEWAYKTDGVDCKLTIANKPKDIASSVADLADRQRIEMTYAQGATQLYAQSLQANCDANNGARMQFYIPAEMRIVNSVKIKVGMSRFRAYSQATSTTDKSTRTSSSGGQSTQTSSSGGGGSTTSGSGGGGLKTTGDGGVDVIMGIRYTSEETYPATSGVAEHYHSHTWVAGHRHQIDLPTHSHSVQIPTHVHSVSIPSHTHTVEIPGHNHQITPGIYFFGSAKRFSVLVNGINRGSFDASGTELDITKYLTDSNSGTIPRGTWHSIEVVPDDLAYIYLDMYVQGFVQSRGDATV